MDKLNEILQEVGISKVKLAKYLGVSRQMVYNYLELDDKFSYYANKEFSSEKLASVNQNRSAIGYPTTEEAALIWQKGREKSSSLGFVFDKFLLFDLFLLIHSL